MLSILFSLQAKKAWASLAGAVVGGVAAKYGLDITGCTEQVGSTASQVLSVGIPGVVGLLATFFTRNKLKPVR